MHRDQPDILGNSMQLGNANGAQVKSNRDRDAFFDLPVHVLLDTGTGAGTGLASAHLDNTRLGYRYVALLAQFNLKTGR